MSQNIDYKAILKAYPETISKEQLYKLCHISKRMAKFYLDNGMIACTNTGHSTHKYIIRTRVMQWHFFGIGRSILTGIVLQE